MKFRLCFFSLFAALTAAGAESDSPPSVLPTVVLLGDSIRMNYQAAVSDALKGKATVSAPKDNCKHTVYMLENLESWLTGQENAQVIHLNVGLHDMFLESKTGKPRHTLEMYEKNLRAIFEKLDQLSDAAVIFALTTAVNEKQQAESEGYGRVVRRNEDIEIYNAKARAVAAEMGIQVNDLNRFMKEIGPEKILRPSDGIHLSPEGCDIMGSEVARVISEQLE
ncbi:MAG: GDSL-type esterase/lipase family protein [Verrucomicrobiales bacterium]|nr:GDSL-type esterase/lipase family protein [bacterium]MDF2375341.1 GDSL-type esterase/lipase family protein [Verrucomicrobiales bacterium]